MRAAAVDDHLPIELTLFGKGLRGFPSRPSEKRWPHEHIVVILVETPRGHLQLLRHSREVGIDEVTDVPELEQEANVRAARIRPKAHRKEVRHNPLDSLVLAPLVGIGECPIDYRNRRSACGASDPAMHLVWGQGVVPDRQTRGELPAIPVGEEVCLSRGGRLGWGRGEERRSLRRQARVPALRHFVLVCRAV